MIQSCQLNKSEIRKTFLSQRDKLSASEIDIKSKNINNNILEILNATPNLSSVGLFYPFKSEVNVLNLCPILEGKKIIITLPVVKKKFEPLDYKIFSFQAQNVTKGYGGILEPIHSPSLDPDIIIVSCSAFNLKKYRIGYGGGFYDRTIEKFKNKNKNFLTILAAFDIQEYNESFEEKYDQKVDFICTETRKIYK